MMANVTRQAVAIREEAVQKYNEIIADVRKLRERVYDVWWSRQEKEEERRRDSEAQKEAQAPALTPKPVGTVSPTIVPALKWTLQEEQPVSPNHPPPVDAAASAAVRSGVIVEVYSSIEEEFM